MKSMKLFESINDIDEKIIKEAESKQFSQKIIVYIYGRRFCQLQLALRLLL